MASAILEQGLVSTGEEDDGAQAPPPDLIAQNGQQRQRQQRDIARKPDSGYSSNGRGTQRK